METLNWISEHWLITFILAIPMFFLIDTISGNLLKVVSFMFNRVLRTIKILARGWPPEHLDADGDWRKG